MKKPQKKIRVLITAGPTWVALDQMRIVTNIFTGKTGVFLARALQKRGYAVTLLLNPSRLGAVALPGVRVVKFCYYDQLRNALADELCAHPYEVVIHTAAVSDYAPRKAVKGKIPSHKKNLTIRLLPTRKLIALIRKKAQKALLIQFKLEAKRSALRSRALQSLRTNKSDYVVANAWEDLTRGYCAHILDARGMDVTVTSKAALAGKIARLCVKNRP